MVEGGTVRRHLRLLLLIDKKNTCTVFWANRVILVSIEWPLRFQDGFFWASESHSAFKMVNFVSDGPLCRSLEETVLHVNDMATTRSALSVREGQNGVRVTVMTIEQ